MIERPTYNRYFHQIAEIISTRATCPRAQVGAVIIRDNHIIGAGYNGAPAGRPHCLDVGCYPLNSHCQRAIHAEQNAIGHAASIGVALAGSILYVYFNRLTSTHYMEDNKVKRMEEFPCYQCGTLAQAAQIDSIRVIMSDEYWGIYTR